MATKKLKGLGRGLDALLGGHAHDTPAAPPGAPSTHAAGAGPPG
jgi:ParB family chromosome partitioning protein